jgi:hypothetical protein
MLHLVVWLVRCDQRANRWSLFSRLQNEQSSEEFALLHAPPPVTGEMTFVTGAGVEFLMVSLVRAILDVLLDEEGKSSWPSEINRFR